MSQSHWEADEPLIQPAALLQDAAAEICVVGAGIAGLTCAYMLAKQGRTVIVLDDGPLGGGETKRTTAHLTYVPDSGLRELERLHGRAGARLAVLSHGRAIDCIEAVCAGEEIDCDFTRLDGWLSGPQRELKRELASAKRLGLPAGLVENGPWGGPALLFPRQAQFHPLKYIRGLIRCLRRDGVRLYGAHATSITGGSPARVETKEATVAADHVIVAANVPINDRLVLHTKQAAYRSYVVAGAIPRGSVTRALYWDTEARYVRLQGLDAKSDLLIAGGEDHKVGQAGDEPESARWDRMEAWARSRFPAMAAVERRWSGQIIETVDGLAFIGRNPTGAPNVYVCTGDCGQGMTHGTVAGMLLTDLILGRPNEWEAVYSPSRKPIRAAVEYAKENLNAAAQYTDWLTRGEVASIDDIPPGSGAVIRRGIHKMAVYVDEEGLAHERNARCPHLGGVVCWNSAEGTWDCPAHGSRFTAKGTCLNGPAVSNLKRIEDETLEELPIEEPPPPQTRPTEPPLS